MFMKKKKKKGGCSIGSCPHVPVEEKPNISID
jgi:hypothetical protein